VGGEVKVPEKLTEKGKRVERITCTTKRKVGCPEGGWKNKKRSGQETEISTLLGETPQSSKAGCLKLTVDGRSNNELKENLGRQLVETLSQ